jgi:high-affinity iron transporter
MLIVTGVLLTIVLAIMVGKTARTMQGVGWLPITPVDLDVPYWAGLWLGIFPTVETLAAQVASVAFVIGSYMVAERLRKPRLGSSAAQTKKEIPDATPRSEKGHEESPPVRACEGERERAGTL